MSTRGTVYFIACSATGRVKIGFTKGDPYARLRALQTGSASELRLMALQPGTIELERALHGEFSGCRLHGEWFQPNDELVKHMFSAVFVAAWFALRNERELDDWVFAGLKTYHESVGELPENLGHLVAEAVD